MPWLNDFMQCASFRQEISTVGQRRFGWHPERFLNWASRSIKIREAFAYLSPWPRGETCAECMRLTRRVLDGVFVWTTE